MYKYDAIGSCERVTATCSGKAEHLIQPLLDDITNLEGDDALWEVPLHLKIYVFSIEYYNKLHDDLMVCNVCASVIGISSFIIKMLMCS